jgi:hypothetical protein
MVTAVITHGITLNLHIAIYSYAIIFNIVYYMYNITSFFAYTHCDESIIFNSIIGLLQLFLFEFHTVWDNFKGGGLL